MCSAEATAKEAKPPACKAQGHANCKANAALTSVQEANTINVNAQIFKDDNFKQDIKLQTISIDKLQEAIAPQDNIHILNEIIEHQSRSLYYSDPVHKALGVNQDEDALRRIKVR